MDDTLEEPIRPARAKELILEILERGETSFTRHSIEEIEADGLTTVDCVNVLRGGVVRSGEHERGTWRYRVETQRITVVVAFRSRERLVVITAWRVKH
jgi:hypothetical protein